MAPNSQAFEDSSSSDSISSDRNLMIRFQNGDEDAATEIYLRYADRLRNLAEARTSTQLKSRIDTEDTVQSVFRTFFRRAANGQYEVPKGNQLCKLLIVIVLNKIRTHGTYHRAFKRDMGKTKMGRLGALALANRSDGDPLGMTTLRLTIDDLLHAYPPSYRDVIDLRLAGYEVQEIADKCDRSKRSVERILQEFRKKLGSFIHDDP